MQRRLNRRKRQLPLRQAPQAAPSSSPAAELYQAAAQMLRDGTTSDAYEFAQDTLAQLEDLIIPAVMDGYEADKETLASMMRHFDTAIASFEGYHPQLEEKHRAVEQARSEHETCHSQDEHECDPVVQCEIERERLWTVYTTKETEYLEVVTIFKHQWCEVSGNRSDPIWRESMSRRFDRFITEGQERITAWEAHESWKLSCLEKNYTLGQHQELCEQKQRALEAASCAQLTIYNNMMENLHTSWAFAIQQYNDIVPRIRKLEEMRLAEFKSLKGIKCLLKWIVDRALKPCDEEEEPGVLEHMISECEGYWQIDVDLVLSPFNLTYPELPSLPALPELQPYPCTDAYGAEYGHLTGSCVPTLACQPCAESPYQPPPLPPASTAALGYNEQEAISPTAEVTAKMTDESPEVDEVFDSHAPDTEVEATMTDGSVEVDEKFQADAPATEVQAKVMEEPPEVDEAFESHAPATEVEAKMTDGQVEVDEEFQADAPATEVQAEVMDEPPEVDEVFESHGPADDDEHFQAHTEVQPMMTEGAPEDLEEFQAEAHESITGDVLKIMSPGVDSTVCAEECGALEACKAVRYFHDPEPTCVLLSHFQVDDHVHDTFTFTFLKDAHDGTVVKHVVEEIVFDSFDDQPEVGKLTFGGIDTDGNGFIDTKEYVELSKRFARIFFGEVMASAMPDSHWDPIGDRAIADLDLNGDGHISREESVAGEAFFRDFIESFREYGEFLKSQSSATGDGREGLLQFSPMPAREGTV